jgi:hypothetical protein
MACRLLVPTTTERGNEKESVVHTLTLHHLSSCDGISTTLGSKKAKRVEEAQLRCCNSSNEGSRMPAYMDGVQAAA